MLVYDTSMYYHHLKKTILRSLPTAPTLKARNREMRAIVRVRILTSFNSLVGSVLSVMVPVTVFAWYTLVNKKALDAAT